MMIVWIMSKLVDATNTPSAESGESYCPGPSLFRRNNSGMTTKIKITKVMAAVIKIAPVIFNLAVW